MLSFVQQTSIRKFIFAIERIPLSIHFLIYFQFKECIDYHEILHVYTIYKESELNFFLFVLKCFPRGLRTFKLLLLPLVMGLALVMIYFNGLFPIRCKLHGRLLLYGILRSCDG